LSHASRSGPTPTSVHVVPFHAMVSSVLPANTTCEPTPAAVLPAKLLIASAKLRAGGEMRARALARGPARMDPRAPRARHCGSTERAPRWDVGENRERGRL